MEELLHIAYGSAVASLTDDGKWPQLCLPYFKGRCVRMPEDQEGFAPATLYIGQHNIRVRDSYGEKRTFPVTPAGAYDAGICLVQV